MSSLSFKDFSQGAPVQVVGNEGEIQQQESKTGPSFFQKLQQDLSERGTQVTNQLGAIKDMATAPELSTGMKVLGTAAEIGRTPLKIAGALGGAVGDVVGEGINTITGGKIGDTLAPLANSEPIQKAMKQYQEFAAKNPELVSSLGDVGNLFNLVGAGAAKNATVKATETGIEAGAKALAPALDEIAKPVAQLRAEKIAEGFGGQNERLKSVQKSFDTNTIKESIDGKPVTVTPIDTFAKYNLTPQVKDGKVVMEDVIKGIDNNVDNLGENLSTYLEKNNIKVPVSQFETKAIELVKSNPELRQAGKVESTLKALESRFKDYRSSYGDTIDSTEIDAIRKVANKDYSPDTQDVSRVLGDASRDVIYNLTPDKEAKSLLKEMGTLIKARKYATSVDKTAVSGGKLGTHFARLLGAAIGNASSNGGVIGTTLGVVGGGKVAEMLQQSAFKSPLAEAKSLVNKISKKTKVKAK